MRAEKSALSEKQIVDDIREGRHEGQTEMVGRYAERVFAMIARMVPDVMDAEELTQAGILSKNAHKTMYVVSPEYDMTGQMIFRENLKMMIRDKNVLLIAASTTTGHTIKRAIDCVDYYGGTVVGAASIFSAVNKIFDVPIYSIFNLSDVPDYGTYKHENCPMCKARQKVDAIANGFGYSVLP